MTSTPSLRASYKDKLQPALHRRFSSTATLLLAVAYVEALLLSTWDSFFWPWIPLGPSGIRTVLIFACGLSILILRIANYHVGRKTSDSGLQTLGEALISLQTYETGFWYGLSSIIFCAIFLNAVPDTSSLHWVTYFSGDRARLNERPLFLGSYLLSCALFQMIKHHWLDLDRLDFAHSEPQTQEQTRYSTAFLGSSQSFIFKLPAIVLGCAKQAAYTIPLSLILYYAVLRSFLWAWALTFLRPFYSLPQNNMLPSSRPVDLFLFLRCIYAGTQLILIWSIANMAFSVLMVREPLKKDKPLTSESKDPNGSLVNGLKSKKLSIKTFAMWELALIAKKFEVRRQTIYSDIDRKDGSTWSHIFACCMELLQSIELRADDYAKHTAVAVTKPPATASRQKVTAPLFENAIRSKQAQASGLMEVFKTAWDQIGRAPGLSTTSEMDPPTKKTWQGAKDRMSNKEYQEAHSPHRTKSTLEERTVSWLRLEWAETFFRQNLRNRFAAAVMGRPYAEPILYIHAVEAICQLAVHSLVEDEFGYVYRDVASLVRTLTAVIRKVDALRALIFIQKTDVSSNEECPEVEKLMDALRMGLEQVIITFEPYRSDIRLSQGDMRLAKEAAARPEKTLQAVEETATGASVRGASTTKGKTKAISRAQEKTRHEVEMEQIR